MMETIGQKLEDVDEYFRELKQQLERTKELAKKLEADIETYYIANKIKRHFKRPAMPCRS
jgi:hypothetical protein